MLDGRNNRFFFPWEQMFFLMQIIFNVLPSNMAAVQNLYSLCKMSKNGNTSPLLKFCFLQIFRLSTELAALLPDSIKLLTTLVTEICSWRAFPTARTAKHLRKFVRTGTHRPRKKYSSFPLKTIKLLVPTPPAFSAHAHFWFFNLQQLVLKICSNLI